MCSKMRACMPDRHGCLKLPLSLLNQFSIVYLIKKPCDINSSKTARGTFKLMEGGASSALLPLLTLSSMRVVAVPSNHIRLAKRPVHLQLTMQNKMLTSVCVRSSKVSQVCERKYSTFTHTHTHFTSPTTNHPLHRYTGTRTVCTF